MLSWTCTVHKVQCLSLCAGVIRFDLERQRSFNQGKMHVDRSGVRDIENLYLIRTYNHNAFQSNINVRLECSRF